MILKLFLSVLILLSSAVGWAEFPQFVPVETPEKGVGDWQSIPFGEIRVLSCTSGVKNLGLVIGGLQVHLNPEWVLKKPTLKPLFDPLSVWMATPVRSGSGRQTVYHKEVFFPFVYGRNPVDTSDFELGVQGIFPACQNDVCMDFPLKINLNLKADEADYTSVCAYIMEQQKQAPLPPEAHPVKGYAVQENDGIKITFSGIKEANVAFLQTLEQDDFQVQETQLEKTGLYMWIKTKPWALNTSKMWVLITNKGIFKVPVLMQSNPISLPAESASGSIWLMGWELFFLTPLFIWWGLGVSKSKKLWQKQIRRLIIWLPLVFILWIIRQYLELNTLLPNEWTSYYSFCLFGIVCLFPPQKWWIALGLFLLWPSLIQLPQLSIGLFILWTGIILAEMMLPFVFLYLRVGEIGKILRDYKKKKFFLFNLTFLIPTLGLLIIGIYGLNKTPDYRNMLNPKGISIVCEKCSSWQEIPNAYFINPKTALGRILLKVYNRSGTMIIFQEEGERFILSPDVSVKKLNRFIKNWSDYHARYMP